MSPARALWVMVGLAVLVGTIAGEKCPKTSDIQAKQKQLQEILNYVNRPYVVASKQHSLSPEEEVYLRNHVGHLAKREVFSVFDERYLEEANASLHYLLEPQTYEGFVRAAEVLRHYVNEDLFYYVFLVAATHRDDTRGVVLPRVHDVYPDKFLTTDVVTKIKQKAIRNEQNIVVDATEESYDYRDPYSRLRYFLEDVAMNSHHFHWHVQNSLLWRNEPHSNAAKIPKDRSGENFYWMHHQMVNRFDAELLSSKMPRVTPFENWDDPIEEGYASHLTVDRYQYRYMFRPADLVLKDLPEMTRNQMRQWRDRILLAIHNGYVITSDGTNVTLRSEDGIDVLAHVVESSVNSVNRLLYGSVHTYAHVIAARIADPDQKYGEDYGVMYDVSTSARDPLFYRWHKYVDNTFDEYRNSLRSYQPEQLTWNDVVVEEVSVEGSKVNKIKTYWEDDVVSVGSGFSYTGQSTARVNVRHLQHEDFTYNFQITNNAGSNKKAVVRVFLAPKYDETGHELDFNEQRRSVIELDKFVQELTPGKNTVTRQSSESSVIQKTGQVFATPEQRKQADQCSCGWPAHLLVPRGSCEGTVFQVYVVVTNYEDDYVESDESCHCGEGRSYCGVLLGQNPDRRPLGYPFDRRTEARTFQEFKTQNMNVADISIQFVGTVKKSA